jgi:hypothetical protein
MADVPLTLAIISTVSPVVAGAIPVIVGWIRDSGREKREVGERVATELARVERERRGACVKLLRQARDFRVLVENTCDSRGSDLAIHAQQIRKSAADITGQADEVGFMVFATEATANSLAVEACVLADTIADGKNTGLGASLLSPDFTEFDRCLANFKAAAQGAFGYLVVFTAGSENDRRTPGFRLDVGCGYESSVPGQFQG